MKLINTLADNSFVLNLHRFYNLLADKYQNRGAHDKLKWSHVDCSPSSIKQKLGRSLPVGTRQLDAAVAGCREADTYFSKCMKAYHKQKKQLLRGFKPDGDAIDLQQIPTALPPKAVSHVSKFEQLRTWKKLAHVAHMDHE